MNVYHFYVDKVCIETIWAKLHLTREQDLMSRSQSTKHDSWIPIIILNTKYQTASGPRCYLISPPDPQSSTVLILSHYTSITLSAVAIWRQEGVYQTHYYISTDSSSDVFWEL
jgi:hypothetical protein